MRKLTKNEFVNKAKEVHGEKYDYSKVEYVNSSTKVCIICPIHGEFMQTPNKHISGKGCAKCGIIKYSNAIRKTNETFIKELTEIYGDKYDYSKVEYVNSNTKVTIICPIHGEFKARPSHLLAGHSCKKCANELIGLKRRLTTEEFIKKANEMYDFKYDYSKTEYTLSNKKTTITCPIHGDFIITPNNHLNGQGCPECSKNRMRELLGRTTEEFIHDSIKIHGDKYDYSKVEYINRYTKVRIICPKHGEFLLAPYEHLGGRGCPICSRTKLTTDEFIKRAIEVHGNKYDYSNVEYTNMINKVSIICPIHGEFLQQPSLHLNGCGCPICSSSKLENAVYLFLERNEIKSIREYSPDWLGLKRLDFYLPDYNVAIECQGIQHFKKAGIFDDEKVRITQESDKIKKQLCEENGVKLLYYTNVKIPDDFNLYHVETDIEKLLENIEKTC